MPLKQSENSQKLGSNSHMITVLTKHHSDCLNPFFHSNSAHPVEPKMHQGADCGTNLLLICEVFLTMALSPVISASLFPSSKALFCDHFTH